MDRVDHHSVVGEALKALVDGLGPFVALVLSRELPPGTDWPDALKAKDAASGRRVGEYQSRDVALLLRVMTERLGNLGYPFTKAMPRQAENYARELRGVRNQWAHNGEFTAAEAFRAVDSAELLLRSIGAIEVADHVALLKASIAPLGGAPAAAEPVPPPPAALPYNAPATAGSSPHAHSVDAPRIDIAAVSDLSYAMAHCRIPVIDTITVDNTGGDLQSAVARPRGGDSATPTT